MEQTLKDWILSWLAEHDYDIREYSIPEESCEGTWADLYDIAYDMKEDFDKEYSKLCPKEVAYDAWYDVFVENFILPTLREIKQEAEKED